MSMNKLTAERNQRQLLELASKPGNDICADCKARNPRWASWNLGIFICVSCASIHRKIGTHVTKVKSLTMDQWTKEQVDNMKTTGNLTSNAIYNPNETRHPPPANMMDVERDSELEGYIRSKYEFKRFMHRGPIAGSSSRAPVAGGGGSAMSKLGPASTTGGGSRSVSSPLAAAPSSSSSSTTSRFAPSTSSTLPPQLPQRPSTVSNLTSSASMAQPRSVSQPVSTAGPTTQAQVKKPEGVWADLIGLDAPSGNSTLPLQIAAQSPLTAQHTSFGGGMNGMGMGGMGGMNGIGGIGGMQSPYTPAFTSTPTFQLQHMQMPPPTTPGSAGYFQPQPQQQSFQPQAQAGLQIQVPTPGYHQTSFTQNGMMSAPAGQGQYMSTPSPGLVGYMGQTPQPPTSTTPTVGFGGAAGAGFNGNGVGGGFNGGVPQYAMQGQGMGQFMAPTPPLQVPGMSMFGQQQQQQPQGQFGQSFGGGGGGMNGMGGQFGQQPQMFGGGGQQWGAL